MRKLNLTDVEKWDGRYGTAHVSTIVDAVTEIAGHNQGMIQQYIADARLYNFAEAWRYLDGYLRKAGPLSGERAKKMAELAELVKKIEVKVLKK